MAVDPESSHDPLHQSLKESFTFPCDDEAAAAADDDAFAVADADADADHELQFHALNAHCAWEHSSPEDPEKPEIHEFEFRIDSPSESKTKKKKMMTTTTTMMSDGDGVLISPADDLFCNGYILPLNHSAGRGYGAGAFTACRNPNSQREGAGGNHRSRHLLPTPSLLGVETLGDRQDELLPWLRAHDDDDDDDDDDEDLLQNEPLRIDKTLALFQLQLDMALQMIQPCEPGYSSIDSGAGRIRCGFSERHHRRGWDHSKELRAREDLDLDARNSCSASNPRSSFMVSKSSSSSSAAAASLSSASKRKCGVSSRSNGDGDGDGDGDGFLSRRRRGYLKLMKYVVMLKSLFFRIRKPCRNARSTPLRSSSSWSSSSPSLSASSSSSTSSSSSSSSSIDHDPFKTPWGSNAAAKLTRSKQPRAYSDVARSASMLRDEAACCNRLLSSPGEAESFIRGAIEHCKRSSARAG